jgi:hypothetical protein
MLDVRMRISDIWRCRLGILAINGAVYCEVVKIGV